MKTTLKGHSKYRPEIDGLRAIAVLSVVIFHAQAPFLSGGFVGVDIFFVISGFLITGILVSNFETNIFSLPLFYAKRIKRLLPAALTLTLVTLLFGYFILTPDKYLELAKSAVMSSAFAANVWFFLNSGYFDQSTEISPLVHMWSLSVEEQYYFIVPVLIFLLLRYGGKKALNIGLTIITLGSFAMSVLLTPKHPDASFYLLHTRAWELCAGGLLSLNLHKLNFLSSRNINVLACFGLLMLGYSLFFITPAIYFPGWIAAVPVIGTIIVLATIKNSQVVGYALLTTRPMRFIGKISYSMYLWHWPIIVYYRIYVSERHFNATEQATLTLLSIIAGYVSWKFVEEKFRYSKYTPTNTILKGASTSIFVMMVCFAVYFYQGFPSRISEQARAITDHNLMQQWPCNEKVRLFEKIEEEYCVVGASWATTKSKAILWGDSHSIHWSPIFQQYLHNKDIALVIAPRDCPAYLDGVLIKERYKKFPSFTDMCARKHQATLELLRNEKNIDYVILAAAWAGHLRMLYEDVNKSGSEKPSSKQELMKLGLTKLLKELQGLNKQVLVIGDIPRNESGVNIAECEFNTMTELLRRECDSDHTYLNSEDVKKTHKHSELVMANTTKQFDNVKFVSFVDTMCNSSKGKCITTLDGDILYRDGNHLRQNLTPTTNNWFIEKLQLLDFFKKSNTIDL
ncbi:acyltransferase family protein [Alteromonas gracilis]|uniref:acyltransferase family protein n=1 Tax=Alteromonas gracilis TaxID=1479524 RepID=UPI0030CEBCEA